KFSLCAILAPQENIGYLVANHLKPELDCVGAESVIRRESRAFPHLLGKIPLERLLEDPHEFTVIPLFLIIISFLAVDAETQVIALTAISDIRGWSVEPFAVSHLGKLIGVHYIDVVDIGEAEGAGVVLLPLPEHYDDKIRALADVLYQGIEVCRLLIGNGLDGLYLEAGADAAVKPTEC